MIWWREVKQRLVDLLPTVPEFAGVVVHNGRPRKNLGAKEWVSVGWSTYGPEGGARGSGLGDSGSFGPTDETVTAMESESGTVMCELVVWGGDESLAADYETRAFELVSALDRTIRDDKTLGVLPPSSTTSVGAEVISGQDKSGATTRLIVSVNYSVRS